MKITTIIGIIVLLVAWLALAGYTFVYSGFNLRNLMVVGFSGVIIFVPVWKRYIRTDKTNSRR